MDPSPLEIKPDRDGGWMIYLAEGSIDSALLERDLAALSEWLDIDWENGPLLDDSDQVYYWAHPCYGHADFSAWVPPPLTGGGRRPRNF